jgi:hypothetical protein
VKKILTKRTHLKETLYRSNPGCAVCNLGERFHLPPPYVVCAVQTRAAIPIRYRSSKNSFSSSAVEDILEVHFAQQNLNLVSRETDFCCLIALLPPCLAVSSRETNLRKSAESAVPIKRGMRLGGKAEKDSRNMNANQKSAENLRKSAVILLRMPSLGVFHLAANVTRGEPLALLAGRRRLLIQVGPTKPPMVAHLGSTIRGPMQLNFWRQLRRAAWQSNIPVRNHIRGP